MHPYSKALMSAVPVPDPENISERIILKGDVPNPTDPPPGCTFHPRCQYSKENGEYRPDCVNLGPTLDEKLQAHFVSCHQV